MLSIAFNEHNLCIKIFFKNDSYEKDALQNFSNILYVKAFQMLTNKNNIYSVYKEDDKLIK